MRTFVRRALSVFLASVLGFLPPLLLGSGAFSNGVRGPQDLPSNTHTSVLHITEAEGLPQTRTVRIGKNKSMLIEMPRDLRDVMVSAPEIVDAVVQTSNRVHLIGKKIGQSNAFFFDSNGEQILTLEISVEQDTQSSTSSSRGSFPAPTSNRKSLNETVILTGSVRTPVDASRASDIASRFIVSPAPEIRQAR